MFVDELQCGSPIPNGGVSDRDNTIFCDGIFRASHYTRKIPGGSDHNIHGTSSANSARHYRGDFSLVAVKNPLLLTLTASDVEQGSERPHIDITICRARDDEIRGRVKGDAGNFLKVDLRSRDESTGGSLKRTIRLLRDYIHFEIHNRRTSQIVSLPESVPPAMNAPGPPLASMTVNFS